MAVKPHYSSAPMVRQIHSLTQKRNGCQHAPRRDGRDFHPIGSDKQPDLQLPMSLQKPFKMPECARVQVSAAIITIARFCRVQIIDTRSGFKSRFGAVAAVYDRRAYLGSCRDSAVTDRRYRTFATASKTNCRRLPGGSQLSAVIAPIPARKIRPVNGTQTLGSAHTIACAADAPMPF